MPFESRPMRSLIYVDCVREEYRHRLLHWLYAMHVPDSISKFGPYVTKYAFYNALPTPPGGERFGTRRFPNLMGERDLSPTISEISIDCDIDF